MMNGTVCTVAAFSGFSFACTRYQLPEGGETVCEVDDAFEVWPGVNTRMIMGNMTEGTDLGA